MAFKDPLQLYKKALPKTYVISLFTMNLKNMKDQDLLLKTKSLVCKERELLTDILHHLLEVERRKLFSALGYKSLFDYCVKELHYSEGQASRRIKSMRLMRELPEIETKIEKGVLNLSTLSQAQSYFRESNIQTVSEKSQILLTLESKSARDVEKILLSMKGPDALPQERHRQISPTQTEVKFIMNEELKEKLEVVRSLLGIKGLKMSDAELIMEMATISVESLKRKKLGKVTVQKSPTTLTKRCGNKTQSQTRVFAKADRLKVWNRADGKCENCGSQRNLNWDHKKPYALQGASNLENLRLLCFYCNQRAAIEVFGIEKMEAVKELQ